MHTCFFFDLYNYVINSCNVAKDMIVLTKDWCQEREQHVGSWLERTCTDVSLSGMIFGRNVIGHITLKLPISRGVLEPGITTL